MSSAAVKNKKKRPRTDSNEPLSFVANVASRVSSLLPSTITKWFSSPHTADGNGAVRTAESEESSTDDEGLDASTVIPAKRMRLNADNYSHIEPGNLLCTTNNFEITEIDTPIPEGGQRRSRFQSMKVEESQSHDFINENKESDFSKLRKTHSTSNTGHSVAAKRKSIFDPNPKIIPKIDKNVTSTVNERKPYQFTPGSTFYPGKIMYGGASSSHINQANIKHNVIAKVNKAQGSEDSAMSTSARRVMDLLESYSSPLSEARRLPPYTRPMNRTRELYIPRQASIMRLKQKSRLLDTTSVRQIVASHSSSTKGSSSYAHLVPTIAEEREPNKSSSDAIDNIQTFVRSQREDKKSKHSLKMKTKINSTGREKIESVNIESPLKLPSVTLKIDQNQLPKFTLDTSSKLPVTSTPKPDFTIPKLSVAKNITKVTTATFKNKDCSKDVFIFSEPITISCDDLDEDVSVPSFTFDNPDQDINKSNDNTSDTKLTNKYGATPNKTDDTKSAYNNIKSPKCKECKLADCQDNKELCVNCNKMKCKKNEVVEKPSKWKCDSCWVLNDNSVNKCVCCNATNPSDESKAAKAAEFAAFPKVKAPQHGGFIVSSTVFSSTKTDRSANTGAGTLVDILKSQKSNKWECSSCLVMNESNKTACVCCGTENKSNSKLPDAKFNFGTDTVNSFKFGIDPKVQVANITKSSETPEVKLKGEAETNNNILPKLPVPNKEESKTELLMPKAKNAVDIKFNFGIPKPVNSFEKKSEQPKDSVDKETSQEVPQIQFNSVESPKPFGQLFTSPTTKQNDKDKKSMTVPSLQSPLTVKEDKITSDKPIVPQVPTTDEAPKTNTSFFLATSPLKPATNLFSAPSTVSVAPIDTSTSSQIVPPNTSTSTMLMPTIAKSDSATSIAPPTTKTIVAASMFSLGDNTTTSSTSITTPSIQFSFSDSNKSSSSMVSPPSLLTGFSNTPSTFNSPFGSRDETVKNTNAFGFTAPATSNAIPSLGPNGLAPNKSLTTNNSAANNVTIGSSSLTGTERATSLGSTNLIGNPLGNQTLSGSSVPKNNFSSNMLEGSTLSNNLFASNNLTTPPTLSLNGGLTGNVLAGGNGLQQNSVLNSSASGTSNIFNNVVKKEEDMWNANSNTSSANLFVTNKSENNSQKAPAFSFGTSSPFNLNSSTPIAFGNNTEPPQNIFGMGNQNNKTEPSLFTSPIQNQPMFGSQQPATGPTSQMGLFGSPNISSAPQFGTTNSAISLFETSSMAAAPRPAFNFTPSAQLPGLFNFGQQQASVQNQQPGVTSFGGGASPQVQFAMGTAPNTAGRRFRKAVRRTTPR